MDHNRTGLNLRRYRLGRNVTYNHCAYGERIDTISHFTDITKKMAAVIIKLVFIDNKILLYLKILILILLRNTSILFLIRLIFSLLTIKFELHVRCLKLFLYLKKSIYLYIRHRHENYIKILIWQDINLFLKIAYLLKFDLKVWYSKIEL